MNDQDRITDLILTEKKMSNNYSTWASECTNLQLRDAFLAILTQSHKTQTDLFQTAEKKGWYQTIDQAPADKIQQAYQQFSNQAPQA